MKKNQIFLLSISLFILILSSSISIVSFNKHFYPKIKEYNEIEISALKNVVYFINNKEYLNSSYFNSREIKHMEDVRIIFNSIRFLFIISLISSYILLKKLLTQKKIHLLNNNLKLFLKYNSFIFISFFLIIVLSFVNFELFFDLFHKLLFIKESWIFSNEDMLIRLFPFEFFFKSGLKIIFFLTLINFLINIPLAIKIILLNKSYFKQKISPKKT